MRKQKQYNTKMERYKIPILTYSTCIWRPRYGWPHSNFPRFLPTKNQSPCTIVQSCSRDRKFSRSDTVSACDGQTDGHDDSGYRASIASRGKNVGAMTCRFASSCKTILRAHMCERCICAILWFTGTMNRPLELCLQLVGLPFPVHYLQLVNVNFTFKSGDWQI